MTEADEDEAVVGLATTSESPDGLGSLRIA